VAYDVIVVGAGPAGSITAYSCAKVGLKTLLIDKARFPREKPCAGGLSVRSMHALRHAGIQLPTELIERTITRAELMGPDKLFFHIETPKPYGYIVRRSRFDAYLAKQATLAGAQFIDQCAIKNLEVHSKGYRCQTSHGIFDTKYLVGADGANTTVGRLTGLQNPMGANEIGIALEVNVLLPNHVWRTTLDSSMIYLWFLDVPYGYFWAFPRKEGLSLGLGGMASGIRKGPALLKRFAGLFKEQKGLPDFNIGKIRGHMLPVFTLKKTKFAGNRVLLTGDAAGLVDTFTGQGICYALESGLIAASLLKKGIDGKLSSMAVSRRYLALIQRRCGRELFYSGFIAQFAHSHRYGSFRMARHLQSTTKFIFDIASGKTSYDRIRRNPLSYLLRLFIYELQTRLSGKA